MAGEPRGGGVKIESREDFESWLDKREPPQEICVALAARAALRALPFTAVHFPKKGGEDAALAFVLLSVAMFRASSLARVAAKYPTRVNDLRAFAARAAYGAGGTLAAEAAFAADAAIAAAKAAAAAAAAANFPAYATIVPGFTADAAIADVAAAALWKALAFDVSNVELGQSWKDLADAPLWPEAPPTIVADYWRDLAAALPDSDGWAVWKRWYEARLTGGPWSEAREIVFATVPDEKWEEGPVAANAWIAERLGELEREEGPPIGSNDELPKPLEDVPSLFAFGENDAGQIDIVSGPQDTPAIAFAGDEETHRQWLDVARELARRLAEDAKAGKFGNLRRDYWEGLERYSADLPLKPGDGNFMLADAEIIALLDLFGAEAGILSDAFGARLNRVLSGHFALLDFYPVARRYHEAARKGRLSPPLPHGAFAGFAQVVAKNSPETFAPRVSRGLAEASREAPKVELDESDRAVHAAIAPVKYPYDYDGDVERRFGKAGAANALYKAVIDRAKDPEKALAMLTIGKELAPYAQQIIEWLQQVMKS